MLAKTKKAFSKIERKKEKEKKIMDYTNLKQISTETREILEKIRPKTLAQALRTGGVKPADMSCLMVIIEAKKYNSIK